MAPTSFLSYVIGKVSLPDVIRPAIRLSERVFQLTLKHFGLMQSTSVFGFGLQEIGLEYLSANRNTDVFSERDQQQIRNIKKIQAKQTLVHGLCYLGSGVLCTLGEMERVSWLNLDGTGNAFIQSGWTLFLFANLFSLDQNIKLYHAASRFEGTFGHRLKMSAILGMISNLGYVVGTIFSFFEGTAAIAIFLAVLSMMTGTVKFFYDYFFNLK